eukprot:CAMPEP_0168564326 /NCGR_PEP_ID=MMETSP0413-20121227/13185_1 /TAXON_ID=136452 /ORGANISM="Filamoeba nolandi, Strain NC-AS-23-1" /LENGTH=121 /DNA_ID=CAMNT_0008595989 /DNA_START=180 /DNA_END=545 /DNA_ORIENTATION=+
MVSDLQKDGYWFAQASERDSSDTTSDVFGIVKGSVADAYLIKPWVECTRATNDQKCYDGNSNSRAALNSVISSSLNPFLKQNNMQLSIHADNTYKQGQPDATTIFNLGAPQSATQTGYHGN